MSYVAIKGGKAAIDGAASANEYLRCKGAADEPLTLAVIEEQLRLLTSRVVSEGVLYHPRLAALSLRRAQWPRERAGGFGRSLGNRRARPHAAVHGGHSSL